MKCALPAWWIEANQSIVSFLLPFDWEIRLSHVLSVASLNDLEHNPLMLHLSLHLPVLQLQCVCECFVIVHLLAFISVCAPLVSSSPRCVHWSIAIMSLMTAGSRRPRMTHPPNVIVSSMHPMSNQSSGSSSLHNSSQPAEPSDLSTELDSLVNSDTALWSSIPYSLTHLVKQICVQQSASNRQIQQLLASRDAQQLALQSRVTIAQLSDMIGGTAQLQRELHAFIEQSNKQQSLVSLASTQLTQSIHALQTQAAQMAKQQFGLETTVRLSNDQLTKAVATTQSDLRQRCLALSATCDASLLQHEKSNLSIQRVEAELKEMHRKIAAVVAGLRQQSTLTHSSNQLNATDDWSQLIESSEDRRRAEVPRSAPLVPIGAPQRRSNHHPLLETLQRNDDAVLMQRQGATEEHLQLQLTHTQLPSLHKDEEKQQQQQQPSYARPQSKSQQRLLVELSSSLQQTVQTQLHAQQTQIDRLSAQMRGHIHAVAKSVDDAREIQEKNSHSVQSEVARVNHLMQDRLQSLQQRIERLENRLANAENVAAKRVFDSQRSSEARVNDVVQQVNSLTLLVQQLQTERGQTRGHSSAHLLGEASAQTSAQVAIASTLATLEANQVHQSSELKRLQTLILSLRDSHSSDSTSVQKQLSELKHEFDQSLNAFEVLERQLGTVVSQQSILASHMSIKPLALTQIASGSRSSMSSAQNSARGVHARGTVKPMSAMRRRMNSSLSAVGVSELNRIDQSNAQSDLNATISTTTEHSSFTPDMLGLTIQPLKPPVHSQSQPSIHPHSEQPSSRRDEESNNGQSETDTSPHDIHDDSYESEA